METIGKFRTNFLGKGKSFKIGFNNRSPFSYISSTGPEVPARYDGGVELHMFQPSEYAKAFDSSDAVRAEHEMYKKAGEAAGKVVGTVGAAVAGGIKASNNPGAGFGDFLKGAGEGAKNYDGLLGDKAKKGVESGMSDIRTNRGTKSSSKSSGPADTIINNIMPGGGGGGNTAGGIDYEATFKAYADKYSKDENDDLTTEQKERGAAIHDCMNGGGTFDPETGNCN